MENNALKAQGLRSPFDCAMYPDISSPELYKSYFQKDFWSLDEFGALMAGLTPDRFYELESKQGEPPSDKEINQQRKVNCPILPLLDWLIDTKSTDCRSRNDTIILSCWRYIKFLGNCNIKMPKKFFEALPLILMELYMMEFQPINDALRTKSKFSRSYHEALYLKRAQGLIESSPNRLTRNEIYENSQMQNVMDQFQDHSGKRAYYKKRTVIDSWLKKIDSQPRGRPKTKAKNQ